MPRKKQALLDAEIAIAKALAAGVTYEYLIGRVIGLGDGFVDADVAKALTKTERKKVVATSVA